MKQFGRVPPQFFRVGFMLCGHWNRETGSPEDTSGDKPIGGHLQLLLEPWGEGALTSGRSQT